MCTDFGDVVVDATLNAEHAVLEIRNVKEAARRLSDLAERHEEKKRWSCGWPSRRPSPTTHSCVLHAATRELPRAKMAPVELLEIPF